MLSKEVIVIEGGVPVLSSMPDILIFCPICRVQSTMLETFLGRTFNIGASFSERTITPVLVSMALTTPLIDFCITG
jgi:hypothetical protein